MLMRSALIGRRLLALLVAPLLLTLASCGGAADDRQGDQLAMPTNARNRSQTAAALPALGVIALTKVGETRISRTVSDFVFKVTIQNDSIDRTALIAEIKGTGAGTTVVRGAIALGKV